MALHMSNTAAELRPVESGPRHLRASNVLLGEVPDKMLGQMDFTKLIGKKATNKQTEKI